MAPLRRVPGGVVPSRRGRQGGRRDTIDGAPPFDRSERPLGMIPETWVPKEEPGLLKDELPKSEVSGRHERFGPSLTVWIILVTLIVVVILAVISYRNAPP